MGRPAETTVDPLNQSTPLWRDRQLLALLVVGSLTVMTGAVLAPILPAVIEHLTLDPALAGSLVSIHYLTVGISSPVLGLLANRWGQRPILIWSLLVYAGLGVAGAMMPGFMPLLIDRALLGVATGGIAAASLGLLGQVYPDSSQRTQAIAYVSSALTLANIIYPLLGGWLGTFHWQITFGLYALGLPFAYWVQQVFPAHLSRDSASPAIALGNSNVLGQLVRHPALLGLLLGLTLTSATVYSVIVYLPLHLTETLGLSTALNGLILAVQAVGAALISALGVKRLTRRFGPAIAAAAGLSLMSLALLVLPHLIHLLELFPVAILFGMGFGIVVPSIYTALADMSPTSVQTSILAIGTGASFLGQFLAPIAFGIVLAQGGLLTVFIAAATTALLNAGLLLAVARKF